jgi:hypothetical protein
MRTFSSTSRSTWRWRRCGDERAAIADEAAFARSVADGSASDVMLLRGRRPSRRLQRRGSSPALACGGGGELLGVPQGGTPGNRGPDAGAARVVEACAATPGLAQYRDDQGFGSAQVTTANSEAVPSTCRRQRPLAAGLTHSAGRPWRRSALLDAPERSSREQLLPQARQSRRQMQRDRSRRCRTASRR